MKKIYSLITILFVSIGFAQIPAGYYDTATGTGYTLKTQLKTIITNGFIDKGYSGLWTTYQTSDRDVFTGAGYENDNTIYDIYTENPTGTDACTFIYSTSQDSGSGGTSECQFYNREHIIPQSIFNSANPMHNDAHFIPPTDKKVNGVRSDFPHGTVLTATYTSLNGGKLGSSSVAGYAGTVFEPNSAFKGDIARMYFYFATRYQTELTTWGNAYPMFNGTNDQVFTPAFLTMLLTWHINDPVSQFEITRNNAIYARQNNRNPFIDHPEYVCQIWNVACAALSNEDFVLSDDSLKIYPNPSNGDFNIKFDNSYGNYSIEIFSLVGQKVYEKEYSNDDEISISNLQQGMYLVKVTKDSKSIIKKIVIN
ncbi:endonuclease [Flavobacterium sp.]|uniref:endonuclease n=1 Tax=Flavobacterium sp. TaxID=239 RepID=UPI00262E6EBA|nr:endonuclease [Flavobacterium sp.]